MSLHTAFYYHLKTDDDLVALISTRIYVDVAPASVAGLDHVTYQVVSAGHEHHLTAAAGMVQKRVQVDVWATTSITRDSISEAIREALDGYRGDMGEEGSTVSVRCCHLSNELDSYDSPQSKNEFGVFRHTMDFMVWHTESVPTFD